MKLKNIKAFTLVEVLAVIVVLGILLLIAVPSVTKYIENSKDKTFFTSVSNIVNKIKTENLLEEKDYCIYSYNDDKENHTENINSLYVIAHKENDKVIYSVHAKRTKESIDIDVYDFNSLKLSDSSNWVQSKEDSYSFFALGLFKDLNEGNIEVLKNYKVCGIKK